MKIANVQPNTQAWLELRKNYDTASEAPAALGVSKYTSRTDLLNQKSTGFTPDVDQAKQRLFDRGHESEALARPLAEEILETDLYPVTATLEINGLKLLASLDGATMDETIIFEHKLWSESLAADVRNGTLSAHYTVQMDQQLLVSGANKCLFMVSDGTKDKMVWTWYEADQAKFAELIAGWQQFHADLANHSPKPAEIKPVGKTPETLPALHVEVTGMVTASNLAQYKEHAMAVFSSINRVLKTDTDFADADKIVKWCGDVESRLEQVKEHALSQTQSIDVLFKTIDDIKAKARETRLELDRLVTKRKAEVKDEMVLGGRRAYEAHVATLKEETGGLWVPIPQPDFAGAIKGKRSLDVMQDAVDTMLSVYKVAANDAAAKIRANLAALKADGEGFEFLFNDRAALIGKSLEDLKLLIKSRISDHKAAEAAKEEATRERIRAEEQAKAEKEAREKLAAAAPAPVTTAVITPGPAASAITYAQVVEQMPPAVRQAMAPKTDDAPTLKLGQINERMNPFSISVEGLRALGIEPAAKQGASTLYRESDWPRICEAAREHFSVVCEMQAA